MKYRNTYLLIPILLLLLSIVGPETNCYGQNELDSFDLYGTQLKKLVDAQKLEAAKLKLDQLAAYSESHNSSRQADLLFYEGFYYLFRNGTDESYIRLTKAAKLYEKQNDIRSQHLMEAYLCANLYFMHRTKESLDLAVKILRYPKSENEEARAIAQNIIAASSAGATGDPDEAILNSNEAIAYFKTQNDHRRLLSLYGILAACYREKQEIERALIYIDSSTVHAEAINNLPQIAFLNIRRANAYFELKQTKTAFNYLEKARKYYEEFESNHGQLAWIYGLYSNHFVKENDYENAFLFKMKSDSIQSEKRRIENDQEVSDLLVQYETEKKENLLKISELSLAVSKRKNYYSKLIFIGSLVFLSLMALQFYFWNRAKQARVLNEKNQEHQRNLLKATIQSKEIEQERISRDLHDGIGQQLAGIKMGFLRLMNSVSNKENEIHDWETLNSIIEDTSTDLRNISHQMSPKSLKTLGLISAVDDLLYKSFNGSAISYEFEKPNRITRFDPQIEIGIYRVFQELVSNIIKHSKATKIDVVLNYSKKNIQLFVEDNGVGIDAEKKSSGHGQLNILARIQALNGTINSENIEPSGLSTTIRIPLNNYDEKK